MCSPRSALIPILNRIVPLPPQIPPQIRTQALVKVVVVVVAHVQEKQNAVGADPGLTTPVPVHALVQCRAQAQKCVPLHEDGTPPVHGLGL